MNEADTATPPISQPDRLQDLTGGHYHSCLIQIHNVLKPRSYLEIGTFTGATLQFARCAAIAVDPQFHFERLPIGAMPALCLFQMGSDDFFKSYDPRSILGLPIDFAFIDGMHALEYVLRDFIHTERACHEKSVIALHDCVPLDLHMARRNWRDNARRASSAHPEWWAGDVWKMLGVFRKYRPDLSVDVYNAPPTGLVVVRGLDPDSSALTDSYDEIVDRYREPADETALFAEFLSSLEIRDTTRLVETLQPG